MANRYMQLYHPVAMERRRDEQLFCVYLDVVPQGKALMCGEQNRCYHMNEGVSSKLSHDQKIGKIVYKYF